MRWLLSIFPVAFVFAAPLSAAPSIKVSPSALAFTFQEGSNSLPAAQTLSVSAASGGAATTVSVRSGGSQWMTFSPAVGKTTLTVRVSLNPTSLPIGQYTEAVVLMTPETDGDPITIPVTLTVRAAPADLKVSPTAISVVYRLGEVAPTLPAIGLSTTGGLLAFSASTATKWLRVNPTGGAVFPGFRTSLTASVEVGELTPGNLKGSITVSSPDAITKSTTINVNLAVQPGQPVANSVWPPRINVGASDTTITITGERFFSGTVVKTGATTLRTNYLSPYSLHAVIPSGLLSAPGNIPLVVTNPDPGGGPSGELNFEVQPPGPLVLSIANAASQLPVNFAPGTVLTIYGSGLGPDVLESYDGNSPYLPRTLGGTRVYLNGDSLPIIYTSARQVSVVAPNDLPVERAFMLEVVYGPLRSTTYSVLSAAASPGVFTANGSGMGNAAALQFDPVTGDMSLNGEKTPATKGSILVLYVTGIPPILPYPPDGFVATQPSQSNLRGVTVQIGDAAGELQYAGFAPGLVTGIVQINVKVPDNVTTGKAVPLIVRAGNISSQPGVTLNIK
ncbi:MAG TPA: IPT/TIG domain-containing protein [Bryobacteraceae bacterium]|nr:IPT/TIG domain-containing protein [Bryobacteraceae bacterium]